MSRVRNNPTEKVVIDSILVLSVVVVSLLHHFAVLKLKLPVMRTKNGFLAIISHTTCSKLSK